MTDRERLLEILNVPIHPRLDVDPLEAVADYLLDNGVTFAKDTNVPSWIPVSERLPDKDGRFLCLTKVIGYNHRVLSFAKDGEKVDYYDLTGKKDVWYAYDREWGFVATNSVTHWMPLPEPPKEVGHG